MAEGRLVSVDFVSEHCGNGEMLLHVATPIGGVCAGKIYWYAEGLWLASYQTLHSALERIAKMTPPEGDELKEELAADLACAIATAREVLRQ